MVRRGGFRGPIKGIEDELPAQRLSLDGDDHARGPAAAARGRVPVALVNLVGDKHIVRILGTPNLLGGIASGHPAVWTWSVQTHV